jgi:hypothetical protein
MQTHYIILQNTVTFRVDWRRLQHENYHLHLIASANGLAQLSDIQKSCFTSVTESDFTQSNLLTIVEQLINDYHIDVKDAAIITNDEYALGHAARLRETSGIKGALYRHVEPFINKIKMKERMAEAGIRIPRHIMFEPDRFAQNPDSYIDRLIEKLGTEHIFAKQIDAAASEGTTELTSRHELTTWCEAHASQTHFELDEYLQGELYHVDCLIKNGKVIDIEVCLYSIPNAEFLKGIPLGSRTLTPGEKNYDALVDFNSQVLAALSPVPDGATHHEIFRTKQGEWVFLEIAARAPGGMAPQMYEKHTGANIEESHFRVQMGLPLTTLLPVGKRHFVSAWMWYPQTPGKVIDVTKDFPDIQSRYTIEYLVETGEELSLPKSIRDRVANLLLWNGNQEQLAVDFAKAKALQPVIITNP